MIIDNGRRAGKTFRLIFYSSIFETTIICKSDAEKKRIMTLANNLELKIKEPKTLEELKAGD